MNAITLSSAPPQDSRDRKRRKALIASVVVGAIIVHVIIGVIAAGIIVARYFAEPKATFEMPKTVKIPVQAREHKMNMAAHEAMAPKPTYNDRLVSINPAAFSLPEMPRVDMQQMLPLDPSQIVSDQVSSLVGSAGLGSGMGAGGMGSGGTGGMGMSFFGIETTASRILLLFDVSGSVVNKANDSGVPLSRIKEETLRLLEKLPLNARFSIVQFVRFYKPLSQELMVASPPNRQIAKDWIENEWNESGMMPRTNGVLGSIPNGLPIVLDFAFTLRPDVIFLISDGSFEQTLPDAPHNKVSYDEFEAQLKRLQAAAGTEVPIHFLGFQMRDDDKTFWKKMATRYNGKLREITAGGRPGK